jgi:hypothetical protein
LTLAVTGVIDPHAEISLHTARINDDPVFRSPRPGLPMKNRPLSAVLDEIVAAYRQPAKKRLTVRLSDRELAVLTELARGRPASAALEEVVAAYLQQEMLPEHRNKSVKKGSFIINAALLQEVQKMATETRTTASEVIRAALRHSDSNRSVRSSNGKGEGHAKGNVEAEVDHE